MENSKNKLFKKVIIKIAAILIGVLLIMAKSIPWPEKNILPPMGWEPWNIDHCGQLIQLG